EGRAYFNLRYRVQGTPDMYSSYTYIGGGGAPHDLGVWSSKPLPRSRQYGESLSYLIDPLTFNTPYCFSLRAYADEIDYTGDHQNTLSPWSGEQCATTEMRAFELDPGLVHDFGPTHPTVPNASRGSTVPGLGSAIQTDPDLVAVSITGPASLK